MAHFSTSLVWNKCVQQTISFRVSFWTIDSHSLSHSTEEPTLSKLHSLTMITASAFMYLGSLWRTDDQASLEMRNAAGQSAGLCLLPSHHLMLLTSWGIWNSQLHKCHRAWFKQAECFLDSQGHPHTKCFLTKSLITSSSSWCISASLTTRWQTPHLSMNQRGQRSWLQTLPHIAFPVCMARDIFQSRS